MNKQSDQDAAYGAAISAKQTRKSGTIRIEPVSVFKPLDQNIVRSCTREQAIARPFMSNPANKYGVRR